MNTYADKQIEEVITHMKEALYEKMRPVKLYVPPKVERELQKERELHEKLMRKKLHELRGEKVIREEQNGIEIYEVPFCWWKSLSVAIIFITVIFLCSYFVFLWLAISP